MINYRENENLNFEEYCDFLRRSDLGEQYPEENFEERVRKLLTTRSIAITARNSEGKLVGIASGITDFVYFLFVTDLGVDREYMKQGIGRELLSRLEEAISEKYAITVVATSHETALGFYKKCGYVSEEFLICKPASDLEGVGIMLCQEKFDGEVV
jgi:ribosomal protein S18 acetylase RimI-like enzyme